jgi:hypothetical protein
MLAITNGKPIPFLSGELSDLRFGWSCRPAGDFGGTDDGWRRCWYAAAPAAVATATKSTVAIKIAIGTNERMYCHIRS